VAIWRIALAQAALCSAIFIASARAQNADEPRAWVENFFDILLNKQESEAFRLLKEETFVGHSYPGGMSHLEEQYRSARLQAGTPINVELVSTQAAGSRYIRFTYVMNGTSFPVIWYLDMYNSDNGWQLLSITFTGDSDRIWNGIEASN
jgi:hypothetical protein